MHIHILYLQLILKTFACLTCFHFRVYICMILGFKPLKHALSKSPWFWRETKRHTPTDTHPQTHTRTHLFNFLYLNFRKMCCCHMFLLFFITSFYDLLFEFLQAISTSLLFINDFITQKRLGILMHKVTMMFLQLRIFSQFQIQLDTSIALFCNSFCVDLNFVRYRIKH